MTARRRTPKVALQTCSLASPAVRRGRLDRADPRRPCRPARLWRKTLPGSQPLRGTATQRLRPSARRGPGPAAPLVSGSRADLPSRLLREERPALTPGLSPARRLRRASPRRARGSRLQSRTARAVRHGSAADPASRAAREPTTRAPGSRSRWQSAPTRTKAHQSPSRRRQAKG